MLAIVVHACGFTSEGDICKTCKIRLELAANEFSRINKSGMAPHVIISGGVPYQKGGALLANKMADYFADLRSEATDLVYCAMDCYNSSTDIQNVLRIAQDLEVKHLLVISSTWHLSNVKPMYQYWLDKFGVTIRGSISVEYLSPEQDVAGLKTKLVYALYSLLVKVTISLGYFELLDSFLNKRHIKRRYGYQVSGCD